MIPWRSIVQSGAIVLMFAMLAGRIAGFFREILIARTFGLTEEADFAIILLTLPDLLVGVLLSGGLAAALIPRFSQISRDQHMPLMWQASVYAGGLFVAIGLLVALFPNFFLAIIAPGYIGFLNVEIRLLFIIVAIAVPLSALSGVASAKLNSDHLFFIPGLGTFVFNASIIMVLLLWPSEGGALKALSYGIVLGAFARYLVQLLSVKNLAFIWGDKSYIDKDLVSKFGIALTAASIILLIPVFMRSMASLIGVGNLAAFNYANKLVELPVGIVIATMSTVAFPRLSRSWAGKDEAKFISFYKKSIFSSVLIAIVAMIVAISLTDLMVGLIFSGTSLFDRDMELVADLAKIGFLSLPMVAISSMATAVLNAQGKQKLLLRSVLLCGLGLLVFMLPGIFLEDIVLQMTAFVLFQVLLAVKLLSVTKSYWWR